jgi:hypothetical protein
MTKAERKLNELVVPTFDYILLGCQQNNFFISFLSQTHNKLPKIVHKFDKLNFEGDKILNGIPLSFKLFQFII